MASQQDKLKVIQERCKTDLKFLCTKVLEMDRWSSPLHDDLTKFVDGPDDSKLVLMPRGHQKTTIITVGWVIQQLLKNPDENILIVSAIWDLSRSILRQISGYMTSGLLPQIFGDFQTPQTYWTKEAVNINQRKSKVAKDPSISTAGIDSGKTGAHCSLMIFDDIVSAENVTTKEQIQKVTNSYKDCLPLLNPGGRRVIIGTRWAISDIYGQIIENDMKSLNGHGFETVEERKRWRDYAPA